MYFQCYLHKDYLLHWPFYKSLNKPFSKWNLIIQYDYVLAASSSSGFDRHTSLVFNPTYPESSIEDCLAALGDEVVNELDEHLATAVDTLLAGLVQLM